MTRNTLPRAAGTNSSVVVERCQVCDAANLHSIMFLGYLPPVNEMPPVGSAPRQQPSFPAELLRCAACGLVQLGLIVDPQILFPPEYPYSSGTTRILRDNFAELHRECLALGLLQPNDLVVDIGSNDGTLLSNFQAGGQRVVGIEPTEMGQLARERGIPTTTAFFGPPAAAAVRQSHGAAAVATATNVFAHIEDVHQIVESVLSLLDDRGVFITESHYLLSLLETLQYDTIYHEHLRYYSLHSLQRLLEMHGLQIFHARRIPTHGGSIRVYAARAGVQAPRPTVAALLAEEQAHETAGLKGFKRRVVQSKLDLYALLRDVARQGRRIYGIGAPSRASTLIHYVGLDEGILEAVLEIEGSHKIGKYMPGSIIPVQQESRLFVDPPDYALLLSWHIADELMPKLRAKGYRGGFIIPLPEPRIVD